jgi:hypothetical protein
MGAGVASCETCTGSYARCGDSFSDRDEGGDRDEDDLAHTSVPRDRAETRALRSAPSTILLPDGWLA